MVVTDDRPCCPAALPCSCEMFRDVWAPWFQRSLSCLRLRPGVRTTKLPSGHKTLVPGTMTAPKMSHSLTPPVRAPRTRCTHSKLALQYSACRTLQYFGFLVTHFAGFCPRSDTEGGSSLAEPEGFIKAAAAASTMRWIHGRNCSFLRLIKCIYHRRTKQKQQRRQTH